MWRRVIGVAAAAAVALALWLAVLSDFPSFHGGSPHLPALGPSTPRPSPGALATPGSPPPANPQAQAGLPGSGSPLTGGGNRAADVEDEPPDVEDEPAASATTGAARPAPTPALPALPLPTPSLVALPLPTPAVP